VNKLLSFLDHVGAAKAHSPMKLSAQQGIWMLGSLAQLHSLPFDANLLAAALTQENESDVIFRLGKELGIGFGPKPLAKLVRAKRKSVAVLFMKATPAAPLEQTLAAAPVAAPVSNPPASGEAVVPAPVAGAGQPAEGSISIQSVAASSSSTEGAGSAPAQQEPAVVAPEVRPVLLLKVEEGRALVLNPGAKAPEVVQLDLLLRDAEPSAWAVTPLLKEARLPDGLTKKPFGFSWFLNAMMEHKRIWVDVLVASLVIQVIALLLPLMTQAVVDKVVVNHAKSTLISLAIGVGLFNIFSGLLTWIRQMLVIRIGNAVDGDLAIKVFSHLIRLPMRYFQFRPTGTLVTRIHGVETIRNFLTGAFTTLALDLPFLLIFLVVMFYYSIVLSCITLTFVALMVGLSYAVGPALREKVNHQYLFGAQNQAFLTEYIGGMEAVKSLQMEPQVESRFSLRTRQYLASTLSTRQLYNHYSTLMQLMNQMSSLTILAVGAYLSMTDNNFTLGMLVAFQMFANRVSDPLLKISNLWQDYQQTLISVKRIGDVMDVPNEPSTVVPSQFNQAKGKVEIRNLGFRYDKNRPNLYNDLNLTIEPGQVVTLLGPSGSGKSTIAKLLQGFYPEYEGTILLDGQDMRSLPLNAVRQYFGVVPQETTLFSGTIYDNLIAANPHATPQQVAQACQMASIHSVIEGLPNGYQTEIGERGAGLSGGQKQRLAIARALLKRPKVLIFDEATSSLDPMSATEIAETVNGLRGKVAMLFVAHNLPRNLKVDHEVVLKKD
jgi:subfamily B ATP-binding cassette protein HlyB/CyaB